MTTTDMKAALQACVDALLHDGIPTDPYHPRRIALNAAEAALASRSDAQADERGAFEAWWQTTNLGDRNQAWHGWKARAAAPQAARDQHEKSDLYKEGYLAGKEAARGVPAGWSDQARKALEPFASIGQWLFARSLPDDTPVVDVRGLNGQASALTRGMFKAAHMALAAAPSPDREQVGEDSRRVDELSMLIRQLVHALRKAAPDNDLAGRAGDYLKRAGLQGSPLRVEAPDAPPSRECGEQQECPHGVDDGACGWCYDEKAASAPTPGEQPQVAEPKGLTDEQRAVVQKAADVAFKILIAGGDYGDELADFGLRTQLKDVRAELCALLSKGA